MHGGEGSITVIDERARFPDRVAADPNAEQRGSISSASMATAPEDALRRGRRAQDLSDHGRRAV
jgi:hypothetical protein